MDKIKLDIVGLSSGQTSGSYTLILGEENGKRKLPVIIGNFEAQAIAVEIEKIVPFRPMTHDLFVSFSHIFNIDMVEALIYNLHEGVFYAKLICVQNGKTYEIDSRTSDAIALAVRFKCPIYTYDNILESAGIVLEEEDDDDIEQPGAPAHVIEKNPGASKDDDLSSHSLSELDELLEKALQIEDYHNAARIRDEINKRK